MPFPEIMYYLKYFSNQNAVHGAHEPSNIILTVQCLKLRDHVQLSNKISAFCFVRSATMFTWRTNQTDLTYKN